MQEDDEASSTVKSTITVSNYLELSSLLFCMKTTSITTISETVILNSYFRMLTA